MFLKSIRVSNDDSECYFTSVWDSDFSDKGYSITIETSDGNSQTFSEWKEFYLEMRTLIKMGVAGVSETHYASTNVIFYLVTYTEVEYRLYKLMNCDCSLVVTNRGNIVTIPCAFKIGEYYYDLESAPVEFKKLYAKYLLMG